MSAEEIEWPFESIESAYDYMDILAITTLEVMSELKRDRDQALRDGEQRHTQAIDLAILHAEDAWLACVQGPAYAERSPHSPAADFE
jgi:hypothetical protein